MLNFTYLSTLDFNLQCFNSFYLTYFYFIDILPYNSLTQFDLIANINQYFIIINVFTLFTKQFYFLTYILNYYIIMFLLFLIFSFSLLRWQLFSAQFNFIYLLLLTENEKELNAADDLIYVFVSFLLIFIYNFSIYSFFSFTNVNLTFLYFMFFNLFFILISIPLNVLVDYGFYFCIYIRGCSNSLIISYEIILDYINILAYWLRIIIQLIRLIVIFVTFYTFNEMYCEYYYYYVLIFNPLTTFSQISYNLIINIMYFLIHWFFEFWHLLFIFLLQSIAFNIMVL